MLDNFQFLGSLHLFINLHKPVDSSMIAAYHPSDGTIARQYHGTTTTT